MAGAARLFLLIGMIHCTNGLISDFNQIEKSSFKSEWDKRDPTYAGYGYDVAFGGGKIFVVGQRHVRTDKDSQIAGGIVSIYDTAKKTWSHYPHSLDIGASEYRLFTLDSRLHMLTVIKVHLVTHYIKLFAWNEPSGRWVEVPLEGPRYVVHSNRPPTFYVSVPDQDGSVAYTVASSSINGTNAGTIHKLTIQVQRGVTIKASLLQLIRVPHRDMKDLVYVTDRGEDKLHTFGRQVYKFPDSTTYNRVYARFSADIRSNVIKYFPWKDGPFVPEEFRNDHVFQSKNRVIFIGFYPYGRGGSVPHIWIYDLNTYNVQDRNADIPDRPMAIDQKTGRIYCVDWHEIKMATLM